MHYHWCLVKAGYVFYLGNYHLRCLLTCEEETWGNSFVMFCILFLVMLTELLMLCSTVKVFVISKQIVCYDLLISTKVSRRRRRGNI